MGLEARGHQKAIGQAGHHREPRCAERITRRPSATPGITGSHGVRSGSPEGPRPGRASQGATVRGAGTPGLGRSELGLSSVPTTPEDTPRAARAEGGAASHKCLGVRPPKIVLSTVTLAHGHL